jgi:membrane protein implicated in regulation of membrane protease activity
MLLDFLTDYAWIVWVSLILIFLVVEVFTLDFTFLMLAVGSVAGLLTSFTPLAFWVQIVITAIVAVLLIFAVRPPLLRRMGRGADPTPSNIQALIGAPGVVATDFVAGAGYVRIANHETWTSRLADLSPASPQPQTGEHVTVVAIDGAVAVVTPTVVPIQHPDERTTL